MDCFYQLVYFHFGNIKKRSILHVIWNISQRDLWTIFNLNIIRQTVMWPFNLVQHPKVTTWSALIPLLEFDRKPRTYLIRLFSHTETRRFHFLCLTDSFLMIPLPRVPRGTWGSGPPCRAPREQAKARMRWRQVLSGWEQHIYISKGMNVSVPGKHFS